MDSHSDTQSTQAQSPTSGLPRLGMPAIVASAKEGLEMMTNLSPDSVARCQPKPDGSGWIVEVEMLENKSVNPVNDLMATFEAELDPQGQLLTYHRVRRYTRNKG